MHDIKLVLPFGHTFSLSNIIMHRPRDWQRAFSPSHAHLCRLSCTSLLVGNIVLEVTDTRKVWTRLSLRPERNAVLNAVDETLVWRKLPKRKGWQITQAGKRGKGNEEEEKCDSNTISHKQKFQVRIPFLVSQLRKLESDCGTWLRICLLSRTLSNSGHQLLDVEQSSANETYTRNLLAGDKWSQETYSNHPSDSTRASGQVNTCVRALCWHINVHTHYIALEGSRFHCRIPLFVFFHPCHVHED